MQEVELLPFLQEHSTQDIVLQIYNIDKFCNDKGWEALNVYYSEFPNLSVCFYAHQTFRTIDKALSQALPHLKVPYFFGLYAVNFDQLQYLLSLGASQVYLAEDICFDLIRAKRLCEQHNIKVRAFANVAQSSVKTTPPLKKFFIRPEDVAEYSDVIDTLEFWGPEDRQAILLRVYQKGAWLGDLNALLLDFDLSFDSRRIVPGFARARKSCERKCMKGSHCAICDKVLNISKTLADKHLIIKQTKEH